VGLALRLNTSAVDGANARELEEVEVVLTRRQIRFVRVLLWLETVLHVSHTWQRGRQPVKQFFFIIGRLRVIQLWTSAIQNSVSCR
jgi:hypothetical protein